MCLISVVCEQLSVELLVWCVVQAVFEQVELLVWCVVQAVFEQVELLVWCVCLWASVISVVCGAGCL